MQQAELAPPPRKLLGCAVWTNLDEFSLISGMEVSAASLPRGARD